MTKHWGNVVANQMVSDVTVGSYSQSDSLHSFKFWTCSRKGDRGCWWQSKLIPAETSSLTHATPDFHFGTTPLQSERKD
eukprot:81476-Amphidinium_carterae.1